MDRRGFLGALSAALPLGYGLSASELGDDGLHRQDWFHHSFLELSEDLKEAAETNKGLIILFEQSGCPYCRELHQVNFAHEGLVTYMNEYFVTVQLNLFGAREVIDFDGVALEERALANKWAVNFTPTTVLFPATAAEAKTRAAAEAFRLPGYLKPFHYLAALQYVAEGAFHDQPFQRFLQAKFEMLKDQGIKPDIW